MSEHDDQSNDLPEEPAFSRSVPYNGLPPLPPRVEVETRATLKLAIRARTALSDLKGAGRLIPNQSVLIRAIVLQEAKLSSEIENIVTTNDDLYKALSNDAINANPHTKEVLNYGEALWHGNRRLQHNRPLSPVLFSEIASIIVNRQTDVRKTPGTRIGNPITGEIIYSPPEGESAIRGLLKNLCRFLYDDGDIDPIIKLAIAHYQFEAIHPFHDGNGRTGRVINILYLLEQRLLDLPVLYLSGYIIKNRLKYYRGLREVTENGNWEGWITYMLEAVEATAIETRERIENIHAAMEATSDKVRNELPKVYSHELMKVIFSQPYTRIAAVEEAGIAKRQTASGYLKALESIGVLRATKSWRETLYLNPVLMTVLSS